MAKNFIRNNVFLVISTLTVKVIGIFFLTPLKEFGGIETAALYLLAYPCYATILTVATVGIPTTVSKFIAERFAHQDLTGAQRVLRAATQVIGLTSLGGALLLFFGADLLALTIADKKANIHISDLRPSIQVLALAVLTVPLAGVLRGYFQGTQRVEPTSYSQVAEQIVRILLMILAVMLLGASGYGPTILSAGAMLGAVGGGLVALLIMYAYYRRERESTFTPPETPHLRLSAHRSRAVERAPLTKLSLQLLRYSLPISLAALSAPLFNQIDTWMMPHLFTYPNALAQIGFYKLSENLANVLTIFASMLAMTLLPALASHRAKQETKSIQHKIGRAWSMTSALTLPLATMLAILPSSALILLYNDASGHMSLSLLAIAMVFSNLSMTSAGILQGLGYHRVPLFHFLWAIGLKIVGNLVLIPGMQSLNGAGWTMIVAYAVVCGMNISYIMSATGTKFSLSQVIFKPLFCTACMATVMLSGLFLLQKVLFLPPHGRLIHFFVLLLLGGIGALVYGLLALRVGLVHMRDLASLPFGKQLLAKLQRK